MQIKQGFLLLIGPRGLPSLFRLLTWSLTSVTFIFSFTRIDLFICPNIYILFNILLSIFVDAVVNLFFTWLVSIYVYTPYVINLNTHKL